MLQFSKYQGIGNDFLLLDGRSLKDGDIDECFGLIPESVRRICDRRFGVGADGVIVALPPRQDGELRMRIFNADGTEPEMCGNGIRCLARFLADSDGDSSGRSWRVETLAGEIVPQLQGDGRVQVDMGRPILRSEEVPTTLTTGPHGLPEGRIDILGQSFRAAAAGMGNPHLVIPVEDVAGIDLEVLGPALEMHPAFPARTNVHFVQVAAPSHLVMRVWERGAGPTLACGTGACATLVACHCLGLCHFQARVDLPGGPLQIRWDGSSGHVFMTGPADPVFDAVLAPHFLDGKSLAGLDIPEVRRPVAPQTGGVLGAADLGDAAIAPGAMIDCAVACANGCIRVEDCSSAAARARVDALLEGRSLDDLVAIATRSLESRTQSRLERDNRFGS